MNLEEAGPSLRIISGGQTGVDRAALDVALEEGIPCGGWCPEGRRAEDGEIPFLYPVQELAGAGYRQRTLRNLREADGTVVFYREPLEGGSLLTVNGCKSAGKPCLLVNIDAQEVGDAARTLTEFAAEHGVRTLNVAGPRESSCPDAGAYARTALRLYIRGLAAS